MKTPIRSTARTYRPTAKRGGKLYYNIDGCGFVLHTLAVANDMASQLKHLGYDVIKKKVTGNRYNVFTIPPMKRWGVL